MAYGLDILLVDCRISAANVSNVALEMLHIDNIESNDSLRMSGIATSTSKIGTDCEEPHVCLCHSITVVVGTRRLCQILLNTIERFEELSDSFLICILGSIPRQPRPRGQLQSLTNVAKPLL